MSRQTGGRVAASPVVIFLSLLALLGIVVGAVIWAGQTDQSPPSPAPVGSPEPTEDHSLTDAEAIARFKELDALRIRALEERDIRLLRSIFTSTSPAFARGRKSIKNLRESDVTVDEMWKLQSVEVLSNEPEEIELRLLGQSDAAFFDEQGNEVTQSARLERRTVRCVLHYSSEWLIHNCRILKATPIRR